MKIWYLQWRHSHKRERHREFPLAKSFFTIGRSPDNDLQLDDSSISRVHAILRKHADGVLVEDADSVNGVVVGGEPQSRALVRPGGTFELGDFNFTVVRHSMNQETQRREAVLPAEDAAATIVAPQANLDASAGAPLDGPHLAELDAVGNLERRIALKGAQLRLGRSKQCDICLSDRRVSRHHADLYFEHEKWRLVDQGSGNGITLAEGKVAELILEPGVRFCLGGTWFVYLDGDEHEADTLVRDIPEWMDETTADHAVPDGDLATVAAAAAKPARVATQHTPAEGFGGATVAAPAADLPDAGVVDDAATVVSKSAISQEEFLKEGEPCHACAKKLSEGAAYCGNCGTPTLKGMAQWTKRRERGVWALLLAWLCLGGGLLFWAWGFPGAAGVANAVGLPLAYVIGSTFALLVFLYHAAVVHRLAFQTDLQTSGLEWIPVVNVLALTKVARLRNWWAILLWMPLVQIVVYVYVWWRIAYYRRKPRWLGLLVLVPIFGFFVPLFLAQEGEAVTDETMRNRCAVCGTQARRHDRFCGVCGYPRA